VRSSVLGFIGLVVILLLVGLYFTASGGSLPLTEQVSNPEGSTLAMTSNQGTMLAVLIVVVVGTILGMAVATYAIFWLLNKQVTQVQQQPNQPFELLSMGTEGNTAGTLLAENALLLVVLAGGAMVLVAVLLVVL